MTHQELNRLFSEARNAPAETSVEEVTAWVATAAVATTGVIGIAAKLKLFIAKKTVLMVGSLIGAAGITVVSIGLLSSSEKPKNVEQVVATETTHSISSEETGIVQQEQDDSIHAVLQAEKPQRSEVPEVFLAPVMPVKPFSIEMPVGLLVRSLFTPDKNTHTTTVGSGLADAVKGNGNVIIQDREVAPFHELLVDGVFDVYVTQGDKESVKVETDENLQDQIIVENKGNVLHLSGPHRVKKSTKMNLYVTVKDLTRIKTIGIGDLHTQSSIQGTSLQLDISGVGDLVMDLNYSNVQIDCSGVGDITLKGKTNKLNIHSSGVGDLKAYDLAAAEVHLSQSGVGDAEVYAENAIDIDFSGVGDVHYKGNPSEKDIEKTGVGSVKAR